MDDVAYMAHSALRNCRLHSFWNCLYFNQLFLALACLYSLAFFFSDLRSFLSTQGSEYLFLHVFDGTFLSTDLCIPSLKVDQSSSMSVPWFNCMIISDDIESQSALIASQFAFANLKIFLVSGYGIQA